MDFTSFLKMRIDCPMLLARPGSLGAPNKSRTTARMMSRCHPLKALPKIPMGSGPFDEVRELRWISFHEKLTSPDTCIPARLTAAFAVAPLLLACLAQCGGIRQDARLEAISRLVGESFESGRLLGDLPECDARPGEL